MNGDSGIIKRTEGEDIVVRGDNCWFIGFQPEDYMSIFCPGAEGVNWPGKPLAKFPTST